MSVFVDLQYWHNIKDGITLFSPMGNSLGDKILFTAVQQKYIADNPDETVILLKMPRDIDIDDCIEEYKPVKFFWAKDVTNFLPCPDNPCIIKYDLHREATALAEIEIYPKLWFEMKGPLLVIPLNYIVFHIRNIKKAIPKNTLKDEAIAIIRLLQDNYDWRIVLIGNDNPLIINHTDLELTKIFDFRHCLQLPEIAWIINCSRLFIGSDSGIAHLAACCDVPMVSWNYSNETWFPKTPRTDCRFFTKTVKFEDVLQAIKEKLN